jgi:hypothetical protein
MRRKPYANSATSLSALNLFSNFSVVRESLDSNPVALLEFVQRTVQKGSVRSAAHFPAIGQNAPSLRASGLHS